MGYDLYNIDDKIIVKSDKKVGFLSKNPQNELEVSGSTWAKNVTGINFSGTTGYFDTLKINDPVEIKVLNTGITNVKEIYFQPVDLIAQNIFGNVFSGKYFTGENFYFKLFSGNNIYSNNIVAKNLKGENFYIDGIKFLNEKNKILTDNSFFPFVINFNFQDLSQEPSQNLDSLALISFDFNGSSTAGYIKIDEFKAERPTNYNEGFMMNSLGEDFLLNNPNYLNFSTFTNFILKIDYSGIHKNDTAFAYNHPKILFCPADKDAGLFFRRFESRPNNTGCELIFKNILTTGKFKNFNFQVNELPSGTIEYTNIEKLGKWYYMIIG